MLRTWFVFAVVLALAVPARGEDAPRLSNGDFSADGGPFGIPVGWTPFGNAYYEGSMDADRAAVAGDLAAGQEAGLYQVVDGLQVGRRYRLRARARSGHGQLPVRVGLMPLDADGPGQTVWSEASTKQEWVDLGSEATATSAAMLVVLEMRNLNPTYRLLERNAWDDVVLEAVGASTTGTPRETDAAAPPPIPPANDVYGSLANLWSLAWPKPGVRTFEVSSRHPDPANNHDYSHFAGSATIEGQEWKVLAAMEGPGAICRMWMTNYPEAGLIRVEIDGEPVVKSSISDSFGSSGVGTWPLNTKTSAAWMAYTPMPFRRAARVLVRGGEPDRFYWQITWQRFDNAEGVRPYSEPLNATDAGLLRRIRGQWLAASLDPKPAWPGQRADRKVVSLEPGVTGSIFRDRGAGMLAGFRIRVPGGGKDWNALRLEARWDGAETPQVNAPLGLFFGTGYPPAICRGLLMGVTPNGWGYAWFPMPYANGAEINLGNESNHRVKGLDIETHWVAMPVDEVPPMRFHAFSRYDDRAGEGDLLPLLNAKGRGHLVGLSAAMSHGSQQDYHFLEGDEYAWVDGEREPSTAGTGTEDYFTCGWYFQNGPISLAPVGAVEVSPDKFRVSAYRLHVSDWIAFDESLRFAIEVGDSAMSNEWGRYGSTVYYYLEAGAER